MKRNPGNRLEARIPAPKVFNPSWSFPPYGKRRKQARSPAPARAEELHCARLKRIRAGTRAGRQRMVDRVNLIEALRVAGLRSKKGVMARMNFVLDLVEEK